MTGQCAIRNAFVVVVGLGGVGSHATNMLARAGVGRLRLVDFDNVTESSLNRNACAWCADVGLPKVEVCRQYFADVLPPPHKTVETVNQMFTVEAAAELLGGQPDYVVDAIDGTNTKAALIPELRRPQAADHHLRRCRRRDGFCRWGDIDE